MSFINLLVYLFPLLIGCLLTFVVYRKAIGLRDSHKKIISAFTFIGIILFFYGMFYLFNNESSKRVITEHLPYRPPDWKKKVNDINKVKDSLVADTIRLSNLIRLMSHKKVINYNNINKLKSSYVSDSLNIINCRGEEYDLTYPEY